MGTILTIGAKQTLAGTGINQQINFQGRLLNSAGATVPDGNYNIEFKVYQDGNGCVSGGSSPCSGTLEWTEDWLNNNTQGVAVKNGYFSVQLGSITAFGNNINWNSDTLWLSVNIGNTNTSCTPFSSCSGDGEMLPFKRLAASPYALNANNLQGLAAANFIQLAQGVQADSSTTNPSIFVNKTGSTANILELQKSGSDVLKVDNTGLLTLSQGLTVTGATNINTTGGATTNIGTTGSTATASIVNIANTTGNATQAINIGATNSANNAVQIFGGTGSGAISLQAGTTGTISVGTTNGDVVNIGSTIGKVLVQGDGTTTALQLQVGVNGFISVGTTVQSAALNIGNTSASTTTLINGGTSATALQLQVGSGGTISIGTTAQTTALNIGNQSTSTVTTIQGGTGSAAIALAPAASGNIEIGTNDSNYNLLVLDTDTSSTEATGVDGAIYYNTGGNGGAEGGGGSTDFGGKFRCFEGDVWKDCIGLRDISERRWGYAIAQGTSATTLTGLGLYNATILGQGSTGTQASSNQTESNYVQYPTDATSGDTAGIGEGTFSATAIKSEWLPKLFTRIRVDGSNVTSVRYSVGLGSSVFISDPVVGLTGTANNYIALTASSAVNSSHWICNGGNATGGFRFGVDTGVAITANHYYDIIVDLSTAGTLVCSVADNGGAYTTVTETTRLPVTTTALGPFEAVDTTSNAARSIFVAYSYLESD